MVQKKGGFEACRFFGWKIVVSVFIWGNFPLNHDYGRRGIIHIVKNFGESKCIGLSFALAKKSTWTGTWDFPPARQTKAAKKNTRRTMTTTTTAAAAAAAATTTTTTTTTSSRSAIQPSNFLSPAADCARFSSQWMWMVRATSRPTRRAWRLGWLFLFFSVTKVNIENVWGGEFETFVLLVSFLTFHPEGGFGGCELVSPQTAAMG